MEVDVVPLLLAVWLVEVALLAEFVFAASLSVSSELESLFEVDCFFRFEQEFETMFPLES